MVHAHDRLPDEVKPVAEKEVVGLVDASACELSMGTSPQRARPTSTASKTVRIGQRLALGVGEERLRALLGVGARLALVRDDGHRVRA